eukprot:TRINITY_DN12320_c0_g1_i1.p1 TRINITY_DN12320_c0_g1~~TRINITY_DN12320_c0_g1_i1.p1  ORF type:complete len:395 (+),score=110.63 TRINITY_DN12320_c0_g1_i1:92-1276(+)
MAESEEQRLQKDSLARDRMAQHMQAVEAAEARGETGDRGAWKWKIRKRIWDYLEENDIAANPRPVHHRIPNFKGSELTARQVEKLPEFHRARWVKINPDTPQKEVRATTLRHGKMLLVPQPRLRTGFFSVLNPAKIGAQQIQYAVTQAGVVEFGEPIDLEAQIKVDMVVVGSVAVNPANGARIGKGEGFAELEYGMLRWMGAIDDDTPVVSCIHDCQLVDDIESDKMLCHDVPVDIICTPTQVIRVKRSLPKPTGIYWDKLSPQKLASIKILQLLKAKIQRETGQVLPSGPDEVLPPTAERGKGKGKGKGKKGGAKGGQSSQSGASKGGGGGYEVAKGDNGAEGKGKGRWGSRKGGDAAGKAGSDGNEKKWVPVANGTSRPEGGGRRWQPKADA